MSSVLHRHSYLVEKMNGNQIYLKIFINKKNKLLHVK